jgi:hypothetical protein
MQIVSWGDLVQYIQTFKLQMLALVPLKRLKELKTCSFNLGHVHTSLIPGENSF